MSKIAFMFPGQGSFEAGMGKDVAEAVPEAMAVYDEAAASSGMDLKTLCFDSPVAALVSAQSISIRDAITLVRDRGVAMAAAAKEHPGSMAAILGLADEAVETLCHKIAGVWPANYNCPGQL